MDDLLQHLHVGQRAILANAARFNTVSSGRRWGKSTVGLTLAACGSPGGPGGLLQGQDVGWFAPTYKLLDDAYRAALRFMRDTVRRCDAQLHRIEFITGAAFDFWTLEDEDAGRGRRYALVIVDEAAMAKNLKVAWEQSIRPTLTDQAGCAWFFSTPKGRNYFHELYTRGGNPAWPGWASHHAPTIANPFIPASEVEEARRSLPERVFTQEYEAAFLESDGGVFRNVTDAIDDALPTDARIATDANDRRGYVIGVDWGRVNDFTVLVVLDATTKSIVAIDRFTDINYAIQCARLRALSTRFSNASILAESNNMGGPLIEQLQRDGLHVSPFQTTSASKAAAIEALALAFEKGEIRIPRVQWLVDELLAYDQERLSSGMIRYAAPGGMHDDGVMALAIAWHGLAYAGPRPDYSRGVGIRRRSDYERA